MQQACEYFGDPIDLNIEDPNEARLERLSSDLSDSVDTSAIDPIVSFKNLYTKLKPESNLIDIEIEERHKMSTVDPFIRLTQLQSELNATGKEITEYINNNKSNTLLSQTERFMSIIEELDEYKSKLNTFYESPMYKGAKDKTAMTSNASAQKDNKKEYARLLTDYSKSTKKLFDTISQLENSKSFDLNEVLSENIDFIADIDIKQTIDPKAIETKLVSLEKIIGNWEMYKQNKSIEQTLIDKLQLSNIDSKDSMAKLTAEFDGLLETFKDFKSTAPEVLDQYTVIKDTYARISIYESFDDVIDYLKKRLKAVITFHQESTQFKDSCEMLNQQIISNEKGLDELGKKFTNTIDEFNKLELVLKDLIDIENVLKQKYMI